MTLANHPEHGDLTPKLGGLSGYRMIPSHAFSLPVGALSIDIPANSNVTPLVWGNLAFAAVLEHHGYEEIARAELAKIAAFLRNPEKPQEGHWPGEAATLAGHALTGAHGGLRRGDEALTWYVIRSATRQEKRAEAGLIEAGFAVYVPREAKYRDRTRPGERVRIETPLFVGYLFVGLAEGQSLYDVTAVEAVHKVVKFATEVDPRPLSFPVINAILDAENTGAFDTTRDGKKRIYEKGEQVRIVGGPFQGFIGTIQKVRSNKRFEVLATLFGRPSVTLLKASQLDPLM